MGVQIVKLLDNLSPTIITGGLVPRGEYNALTNYTVGDSVSYNGGSYVMYSDAPAGTLPTDTTYWQIIAEGGNVDGPASAVADDIATFDGTTGKLIKDGGKKVSDLVLKAGDTMTGGLTTPSLSTEIVELDVLYTKTGSEPTGSIYWNTVDGTFDMRLGNGTTLQAGQELHFYGKAVGAIANGELCQFAGVEGDHIKIKKAVASEIKTNPHYLVGIATENIANGSFGYVTWFGKVNDVFTTGWTAGDILYFDNTTGQLTNVAPNAPQIKIIVAAVIKLATGAAENGIILVRPSFGEKLSGLDDVDGVIPTVTGQMLTWDNTLGVWERAAYNINDYQTTAGMSTAVPANETDPVFSASEAANITATDITNLSNLSGTNTGDQDLSGLVTKSTFTTKGDLLTTTGASTIARLGVGTDGQVLTADTASTGGVKWATPTGGGGISGLTTGKIPKAGSSTTLADSVIAESSGNIGIGTTSPATPFHVKGAINIEDTASTSAATLSLTTPYFGRLNYSVPTKNGRSEVRFVSKGATAGAGETYFVIASTEAADTGNNLLLGVASGRAFITNASNYSTGGTLHIGGTSWSGDGVMQVAGTVGTGTVNVAGSLGIGKSPVSKLDVLGPASVTSFTGTTKLGVMVSGATSLTDHSGIDFTSSTTANPAARIAAIMTGTGSYLKFGTSSTYSSGITNTALTIDPAGNLGIGTTAPATKLEVNGAICSRVAGGTAASFESRVSGYGNPFTYGGALSSELTGRIIGNSGAGLVLQGMSVNATTPAFRMQGHIGSTTPTQYPFIMEAFKFDGVSARTALGSSEKAFAFYNGAYDSSGTVLMTFLGGGNVGIGIEAPAEKLDVYGNIRLGTTGKATLSVDAGSWLIAGKAQFAGTIKPINILGYYPDGDFTIGTSGTGNIALQPGGSTKMYVNTSGNVGINTISPAGKLDIKGAGTTTGITLQTQDSAGAVTFKVLDNGSFAFKGGTVAVAQTGYTTPTNLTTDRTFDANATTIDELADVLGTLIEDLKAKGIIAA